mmetsp:Transcript_23837/g.33332  ORF Transcript_23837/g.33332 Transcript_23837/m.33332 type:complete len:369 (-) Transcript_23837:1535-2641(-)
MTTELSWFHETLLLLSNHDPNLSMIDFSSRNLCDDEKIEMMTKKLLKTNSPVKMLQLTSNRIGNRSAKAIAKVIQQNKICMEEIDVGVNKLGDVGVRFIGLALPFNCRLQKLHLADNSVSDAGMKLLAEGLSDNSSVIYLDLSNNIISNAGAKAIGKLFVNNCTLKTVNMEWNHCGDSGGKYLCEGLKKNNFLEELNLNCNHIGDKGATYFGEALEKNSGLRRLYLWKNSFSDTGEKAILKGLKKNFYMKELWTNSACDYLQEITFYLALNKHGYRHLLKQDEQHVPRSLWPNILSKVGHARRFNFMGDMGTKNLDLLFYLLQAKADLFDNKSFPSIRKRHRSVGECEPSAKSRRALKNLLLSVTSSR